MICQRTHVKYTVKLCYNEAREKYSDVPRMRASKSPARTWKWLVEHRNLCAMRKYEDTPRKTLHAFCIHIECFLRHVNASDYSSTDCRSDKSLNLI